MAFLKFNKAELVNLSYSLKREIICVNKTGAYCNTSIVTCNTRRYHGLLSVTLDRFGGDKYLLLSAIDESFIVNGKQFNLGIHCYGDIYEPRGHKYVVDFSADPIPSITYKVGDIVFRKSLLLHPDKDQLLIKTDTNLLQVLENSNPLWMESRQYSKIRLSLEMLRENDQTTAILRRIAERNGLKKTARTEAEPLTDEDLQEHTQRLKEVDPAEVWSAFSASSYNLFDFILRYDYKAKRDIEDHAALFCQLVILHPDECRMTGKYATYQDIEYPIIYAK